MSGEALINESMSVTELREELAKARAALHARDKALVEAVCALSKWHALLKKLKTGYDDNSLDVLDQIGATTLESENTIATLNSLLGDKCGVATPPPDNQKGGS